LSLKELNKSIDLLKGGERKHHVLNQLRSGRFICSFQLPDIRKLAWDYKNWNFPIETLQCDNMECIEKRKHKAYYYEWARDFRK